MGKVARGIMLLVGYVAGMALIIQVWAHDWSDRAAMAFAFGAFGVVAALPDLRRDEEPDRAFILAIGSFGAFIASSMIALFVVHSWAWLGLAGAYLAVIVGFEVLSRYLEGRKGDGLEVDEVREEKQRVQDQQLTRSFPHG